MWFLLSVAALLCWSGSDLFSKIGCSDEKDKYSHLKMVTAVGTVMGLHAAYGLVFGGVEISFGVILKYLPVSLLYIVSMTVGYLGLRFIELSVSSPICNSSGAVVAVITFIAFGFGSINGYQLMAVILISAGVIGLGFAEISEDEELRRRRQETGKRFYEKNIWALIIPIIYCILDAAGTFADNRVLEVLDEESANTAYELTFFVCGLLCFVFVKFIKKQKYLPKKEAPKYIGAVCETAGQFAYIYAIADTSHLMMSAPIISSYCAVSVLLGRVFLKEKLSLKHYFAIVLTVIGIAVIGLFDEIG